MPLNTLKKSNKKIYDIVLNVTIFFTILILLLRDYFGFSVNKIIFIFLFALVIFLLPLEKAIYLIVFLMPLYVGIPGNFVTLFIFIRLLLNAKRIQLNVVSFIWSMFVGVFAIVTSLLTQHIGMTELLFYPGLLLILFIFSIKELLDIEKLVKYYVVGVMSLGIIMLICTLRLYSINSLLTSTLRLGEESIVYFSNVDMRISIDPNFYGVFAISSIAVGVQSLQNKALKSDRLKKTILYFSLTCILLVALVGLSRSFVLCFLFWIAVLLLTQKRMKFFFGYLTILLLVFILIQVYMPNVAEAIITRFNESDIASGNGRLSLIRHFSEQWLSTPLNFIFGIGMFDCEVHCTPLQMVFGGGIVLTIIYSGFFLSVFNSHHRFKKLFDLERDLPFIATVLMNLTIPGFLLINSIFPLYFVMLIRNMKDHTSE